MGKKIGMIRVAAITSGRKTPSSRFRIRQHIRPLLEYGIDVSESAPWIDKNASIPGWPDHLSPKYILPCYAVWQGMKLLARVPGLIRSRGSQVSWLSREMLPGYATLERFLKKPLIFDVDDAIWLARPFGAAAAAAIAKRSTMIVAGNEYIAGWFSRYAQNIQIIPTAVDTDRFSARSDYTSDRFTIGWIGTGGNLSCLEAIERPLQRFVEKYKDAVVTVMADKPPSFRRLPEENVRFLPWSEAHEVQAIQTMDVGLMPLPDTEWTRGKCSYKLLQYMSCGVPVVASPVGMNADVLALGNVGYSAVAEDDWFAALETLFLHRDLIRQHGTKGREVIEQHFSRSLVTRRLAQVISSVC